MAAKVGLVLSGGGARGAYQVGVLQGLSDILKKHQLPSPFRIYTGVSAGAINAAFLAAYADDFHEGTARLADLWSNLTSDQVFASDAVQMGKIAITWARDLGFGALTGSAPGKALLNTDPLRQLLENNLKVESIRKHIDAGDLDALALTAVDYETSHSVTFVQGRDGLPSWQKSRRHSEKAQIGVEHVMASSAIPLLFPAASLGSAWFGDGCVRNSQPCAPALYLGAERLLVVGVRQVGFGGTAPAHHPPSVARVINLLLNAVLLDGVELDVDRLGRMNELVRRVPEDARENLNFRIVDYALVSPSANIGKLATERAHKLPRIVRYLLKGLGDVDDAAELISYLMFEPEFCQTLMRLGREDALRQEADIMKNCFS